LHDSSFSLKPPLIADPVGRSFFKKLSRACVILVERIMPDPYVIAVLLTVLTFVLAHFLAPRGEIPVVLSSWYEGVFKISSFAFLVALTLVTGHSLSTSKPVTRLLRYIASLPSTATSAMTITFLVSLVAGILNWAVGLVVSALIAREMAKRIRVDFAWLVAAAYAGWSFYVCGISSSIALVSASAGSPLNIIEKQTGTILPMKAFLLSPLNYIPLLVLAVALPVVFRMMMPGAAESVPADPARLAAEDRQTHEDPVPATVAGWLDNAWIINVALVLLGSAYIGVQVANRAFKMDLNMLVLIFLLLSLLFHWKPKAFLRSVNNAAKISGPILLQFPLYGGIMGIMSATGLADVMSKLFINYSSASTLPFWTFVSSLIISTFVPSAGGHWAVQAPFAVPAAMHLGVSQASVAIAVALGEGAADMIQPMWVIPLLAIAGVGMGRVMGYTLIVFFVMCAVMGTTLLLMPMG
jgi:short-chain fatty acids transporter